MTTPYVHWRREYRESLLDDTMPDNLKQTAGLAVYKRRRREQVTAPSMRAEPSLEVDVSIELDLDQSQANELVAYLRQYNKNATLMDAVQEHYSDRTAALRTLVETLQSKLGDREVLANAAYATLCDVKGFSPTNEPQVIAGSAKPSRSDLAREWAAQKIREEHLLLEALRQCVDDGLEKPQKLALIGLLIDEPPMRNYVLEELPTAELRAKELIVLERAWITLILLLGVQSEIATEVDTSKLALAPQDEDFFAAFRIVLSFAGNKGRSPGGAARASVKVLSRLFSFSNVPRPEETERNALRMFVNIYMAVVDLNQVSDIAPMVERLCGTAFAVDDLNKRDSNACEEFWQDSYGFLKKLGLAAFQLRPVEPKFHLVTRVAFGTHALESTRRYCEQTGHREKLEWFLRQSQRDIRVIDLALLDLVASRSMLDLSLICFEENLTDDDFDLIGRRAMRHLVQVSLLKSSGDEEQDAMDQVASSCLMCLNALIGGPKPSSGIEMILDCQSQDQDEVKNALIVAALKFTSSERVLFDLLCFCETCLTTMISTSKKTKEFMKDCSTVASKVLTRHRRLSRFDARSMSDLFDVDSSLVALRVIARIGHMDLGDAEMIVHLMESSLSERLARQCQRTLEQCSVDSWIKAMNNPGSLVHLFRIMPETSGLLLERFLSSPNENISLLGLLGRDVIPFARQQLIDSMSRLDPSAFVVLAYTLRKESELAFIFFLDSAIHQCLRFAFRSYLETEDEVHCYGQACLILKMLLTNETYKSLWFNQEKQRVGEFWEDISNELLKQQADDLEGGDEEEEAQAKRFLEERSRVRMEAKQHLFYVLASNVSDMEMRISPAKLVSLLWSNLPPFEPNSTLDVGYIQGWFSFAKSIASGGSADVLRRLDEPHLVTLLSWMLSFTHPLNQPTLEVFVDIVMFVLKMNDTQQALFNLDVLQCIGACIQQVSSTLTVVRQETTEPDPTKYSLLCKMSALFVFASRKTQQDEQVDQIKLAMLVPASELCISALDKKKEATKGLVLLSECLSTSKFTEEEASSWVLKEAFKACLASLSKANEEEEDVQKMLLLILTRSMDRHDRLLVTDLDIMRVMNHNKNLLLLESIELVTEVFRKFPGKDAQVRLFVKQRQDEFVRLLRQFRSSTSKFVSLKLKQLRGVVRLIRMLRDKQYLADCWMLVRDLIEFGDPSRAMTSSFLEEFVDHWNLDRKQKPHKLMSRLVLASTPVTREDEDLNQQPIEVSLSSSGDSVSYLDSPGRSFIQRPRLSDLSPGMSPTGSKSPQMRLLSTSSNSPRPSDASMQWPGLFPSQPKVTMFHLRMEEHIEQVLMELLLLFNDTSLVDYSNLTVFPLEQDTSGGPDVSTLVACLQWIIKSLHVPHLKREQFIQRSRLAVLVSTALALSMKNNKLSSSQLKAKDNLRKRLLGTSTVKGTFDQLLKRISGSAQETPMGECEEAMKQLQHLFKNTLLVQPPPAERERLSSSNTESMRSLSSRNRL